MEFIYAAELKKKFSCYGHFYTLCLPGEVRAACRSVLEIVDRTQNDVAPEQLSDQQPDAIMIMMNPGSSRPLDRTYEGGEISYVDAGRSSRKELVPTRPDNTQYQVMRIGVHCGWQHIRVLNLSDLRDPKSALFLQWVETLSGVEGGHTHSLFCPERRDECARSLERRPGAPVMLGWGQDEGLLPLAEQCLTRLDGVRPATVASQVHPRLNAHPSPMLQSKKLEWLDGMIEELRV